MAKNKRASQKNEEISKTVKTLSFAAVALVFGLIATNYFVTSLNFHRQVYSKKNAVEKQLEDNSKALTALESEFSRLERQGPRPEEVFAALPTSADFPNTSATLGAIANRSGVVLNSIFVYENNAEYINNGKEGYSSNQPSVQKFQLNAEVNGDYNSIQEMVERLESSRRVFRVESLELTTGGGGVLSGKMLITTFYVPAIDNTVDEEVFSL